MGKRVNLHIFIHMKSEKTTNESSDKMMADSNWGLIREDDLQYNHKSQKTIHFLILCGLYNFIIYTC